MLPKSLPSIFVAVKNETNRFVGDLLQRSLQKELPAQPETAKPAISNDAGKPEDKPVETPGMIEFVSARNAAPVAKAEPGSIASFFADIPVDFLHEYERNQPAISAAFSRELGTVFQQSLVKPQKAQKKSSASELEGLSLIDDDGLMFRLVLDHFSTKVNEQYKIAIAMICMRFEKVLGFEIDLYLSPLSPFHVSACLEKGIATLKLSPHERKPLLMALLKGLIIEYPQLLRNANDLFIKAGILPKLTEKQARERIEKYLRKMKAREEGCDEDEDEKGSSGDGSFARDFFKNISVPKDSQHVVMSNPNGAVISQEHLLSNISQMQSVLVNTDQKTGYMQPVQSESSFSEMLAANSDVGQFALTNENSKTISIISMLFETLKNEQGISPPIKALLIQLTIPLLKAALLDDEFFSDRANPAQILFNSIAEASSSWQAENNVSNDFLYSKMSEIVQRVTESHDQDYTVFEDAVDDFSSYVDLEKEKSRRVEERIVANEMAQERIKAARKLAQNHIFEVFGDYILDEEIKKFIDKSWEQTLFFIANNTMDAEDSEQWQQVERIEGQLKALFDYEAIDVSLDELLNDMVRLMVSTGRTEADVRRELAQVRPELQVLLEDAMPADTRHAAALKPVFRPAEMAAPAPVAPVQAAVVADINDDVDFIVDADLDLDDMIDTVDAELAIDSDVASASVVDYESSQESAEQERIQQALTKVVIGGWFEDCENDPPVKIKLAAHIKYTDTYVFVNRKGVKAASFDGPTLAARLNDKVISMVDYANLYDRSMEVIIGNLRHT